MVKGIFKKVVTIAAKAADEKLHAKEYAAAETYFKGTATAFDKAMGSIDSIEISDSSAQKLEALKPLQAQLKELNVHQYLRDAGRGREEPRAAYITKLNKLENKIKTWNPVSDESKRWPRFKHKVKTLFSPTYRNFYKSYRATLSHIEIHKTVLDPEYTPSYQDQIGSDKYSQKVLELAKDPKFSKLQSNLDAFTTAVQQQNPFARARAATAIRKQISPHSADKDHIALRRAVTSSLMHIDPESIQLAAKTSAAIMWGDPDKRRPRLPIHTHLLATESRLKGFGLPSAKSHTFSRRLLNNGKYRVVGTDDYGKDTDPVELSKLQYHSLFRPDTDFSAYKKNPKLSLYGASGTKEPDDIKQGQIGDCWFLGHMSAIVRDNPDALQCRDYGDYFSARLFNKDGSEAWYQVDKAVLTDMFQTGTLNQSRAQWPAVYEMALGLHMEKNKAASNITAIEGGDGLWGMKSDPHFLLTGKEAEKWTSRHANFNAEDIGNHLRAANRERGKVIHLGTQEEPKLKGLFGGHAYEFAGMDGEKFKLRNPHGSHGMKYLWGIIPTFDYESPYASLTAQQIHKNFALIITGDIPKPKNGWRAKTAALKKWFFA